MTEDRAQVQTQEYQRLMMLAHQQCEEHKVWLATQLRTEKYDDDIIASVKDIKIATVQCLPTGIHTVYEMPDILYLVLSRPDTPDSLKVVLRDGVVIPER